MLILTEPHPISRAFEQGDQTLMNMGVELRLPDDRFQSARVKYRRKEPHVVISAGTRLLSA